MLYTAEHTIKVNGSDLSYIAFGTGDKALVIIPGLGYDYIRGKGHLFAMMCRIFTGRYRVFIFDKKEDIPEGTTAEDLADDVAAAMMQIGIKKADVIGVSLGGMIAQYLTLNYPHMVHKLVLSVTLSRPNDTMKSVISEWTDLAEKGDMTAVAIKSMEKIYSKAYMEKYALMIPVMLSMTKYTSPERFIRLAKAGLTCDTYDRLDEIGCPVFVIGGRQDNVTTCEAAEDIARKLRCGMYIYEDLGHSVFDEARDYNDRIFEFFVS
ncbi:MAG: alpha/beta fold hydrolase [Oscillospiraceae bacterium]|nr:alpha/beta fold hydrolase [Oscillospiraceae bacterium]